VLVAVAVVMAAAATAAASGVGFSAVLRGSSNNDSTSGSRLPAASAMVTRQTLVDRQSEAGQLGYGPAVNLSPRLTGTLTALPAAGAVRTRGQVLYRVDNTPVVLMYGSVPAYRALAEGTQGPDVKEFEENLRALGYTGFTVDEKYSAETTKAVKAWQKALGLATTGSVDLGLVYFADGPVRVDAVTAHRGDMAQPGNAVLTYTGTERAVVVKLDVTDQPLAQQNAAVQVILPDRSTVAGKITDIQTILDSSSGSKDPTTKVQVTISISRQDAIPAGLTNAAVDVGFTASERANVLTVPVLALLALTEGGYGVQVIEGTTTRILRVETGLFADGRVEVSGQGLVEGMTVGMPS
jgi:membrane fusion protein, multidrug efflux system